MNDRLGRCYELVGRRAIGRQPGDVAVVHGTIQRAPSTHERLVARYQMQQSPVVPPPNPHAWIITTEGVWEPITDRVWPTDEFNAVFNPADESRYEIEDACRHMVDEGHFGPWE